MNELIKITSNNDRPTVSGRDLHAALEIRARYNDWFSRMREYGFEEGKDFYSILSKSTGGRSATDHVLTISMPKELCMLQRTELGRKFCQYFISVEEAWNAPEQVYARALSMAERQLTAFRENNSRLLLETTAQKQIIAEMKPKASYYDVVLNCSDLVPITLIAKDYGMSAKKLNSLLRDKGVQSKQSGTWLLYQKYAEKGYTQSRTCTYGEEKEHVAMHTLWTQKGRLFIYEMLKENGILPVMERTQPERTRLKEELEYA